MAPSKLPKRQYVKLDYALIHSEARKSLSLAARELYVQIRAARNTKNKRGKILNRSDNAIKFGFKDVEGMSKPTFYKAIGELVDRGFIGVMDPGQIPNRKAVYALIDDWKRYGKDEYAADDGGYCEEFYWD